MKSLNHVYVQLSNEGRQLKKQGKKRHRKTVHQLYEDVRRTMFWRVKQFADKQGFQHVWPIQPFARVTLAGYRMCRAGLRFNSISVHPQILQQYYEYEADLVKYWGGGKYYKKMGRMDKVRYKQALTQKMREKLSKDPYEIFHRIQTKLYNWDMIKSFNAIKQCKKARRNIELIQQK